MKPASTRNGASGCAAGGSAVDLLDQHAAWSVAAGARAVDEHARDGARPLATAPARLRAETSGAADRRARDRRRAHRRRGSRSRRRCESAPRACRAEAAPVFPSGAAKAGNFSVAPYGLAGSVAAARRRPRSSPVRRRLAQRAEQIERAGQRELRRAQGRRRNSRAECGRFPPSPSAPDRPRRSRRATLPPPPPRA